MRSTRLVEVGTKRTYSARPEMATYEAILLLGLCNNNFMRSLDDKLIDAPNDAARACALQVGDDVLVI